MSLEVRSTIGRRSSAQAYEVLLKLVIVGQSGGEGVGKTCLLHRFMDDIFLQPYQPTIGVDFKCQNIEIDDAVVKLQMWDTSGQDRFLTITSSYYRGASGIIVVFDLTDQESFDAVSLKVNEISRYAPEGVPKMLVGNKSDLVDERAVAYSTAKDLADELEIHYMETSAKTGDGVWEMFMEVSRHTKIWVEKKNSHDDPRRMNKMGPPRARKSAFCVML